MTKAKKAKNTASPAVISPWGDENEKRAWIAELSVWSNSPNVPEPLREKLRELTDILEWDWFPPRRGPRPKTRWQLYDVEWQTRALKCEVAGEEAAMKKRGEANPRRCAEEAVAARHNITRRTLLQKISRN